MMITLAFGDPDTTPVLQDVQALQTSFSLFDRENCETTYAQCSNTDCSFFNGGNILLGEWPSFSLCGDMFYILLVIGLVFAIPALIVALPILLMVGPTEITIFAQTYSLITDFWYFYAPAWAAFGIGIFGVIW